MPNDPYGPPDVWCPICEAGGGLTKLIQGLCPVHAPRRVASDGPLVVEVSEPEE